MISDLEIDEILVSIQSFIYLRLVILVQINNFLFQFDFNFLQASMLIQELHNI